VSFTVHRRLDPMCAQADTYKYFLAPERVSSVWAELARTFGEIRRNEAMALQEIHARPFILRASKAGNPITVVRRHLCSEQDLHTFHRLIGYQGAP